MSQRILFVIRGKLGDTLVNFMTVRRYADTYPDDVVWLLTRQNYAALLKNEAGIRMIGFDSRLGMYIRLFWLRFTQPAFDVLAVLWGFGKPIEVIGRLIKAKRKIYLDGRFGKLFPHSFPFFWRWEYRRRIVSRAPHTRPSVRKFLPSTDSYWTARRRLPIRPA